MRIFLTIMLFVFPIVAFAAPFDGEFSVFDGEFYTFENGQQVKKTFHQKLLERDLGDLSPTSLRIHKSALAVFNDPNSDKHKKAFLNSFPRSFDLFVEIFHPEGFGQLYDGFIYIHLLHELSKEFPNISGEIILSLASEACLDADAPNYLRFTLKSFYKSHPNIYKQYHEKLSQVQKVNIEKFLSASLHDAGEGTCSFKKWHNK